MTDRLTQASLHPLIQFRVVGFRTMDVKGGIMQKAPKPLLPEAQREYHIGLLYPHKPHYEGVLYQVEYIPGAQLSDEYFAAFRATPYADQLNFNIWELSQCPHCNPRTYELTE